MRLLPRCVHSTASPREIDVEPELPRVEHSSGVGDHGDFRRIGSGAVKSRGRDQCHPGRLQRCRLLLHVREGLDRRPWRHRFRRLRDRRPGVRQQGCRGADRGRLEPLRQCHCAARRLDHRTVALRRDPGDGGRSTHRHLDERCVQAHSPARHQDELCPGAGTAVRHRPGETLAWHQHNQGGFQLSLRHSHRGEHPPRGGQHVQGPTRNRCS